MNFGCKIVKHHNCFEGHVTKFITKKHDVDINVCPRYPTAVIPLPYYDFMNNRMDASLFVNHRGCGPQKVTF